MDAAYGEHIYVDDRTIDSHIKRLRKKFKAVDTDFAQIETLLWRRLSIPRPLNRRRCRTAFAAPRGRMGDGWRPNRGWRIWEEPGRRGRAGWRRPFSPLTWRILAVNVLALAMLAGGFLYLGKYQASLIDQQIESLKTKARIFAAALGEGAVLDSADDGEVLLPDLADDAPPGRADQDPGAAVRPQGRHDRRQPDCAEPGAIQVLELPPPDTKGRAARSIGSTTGCRRLLRRSQLPGLSRDVSPRASDYAEVEGHCVARPVRRSGAIRRAAGWCSVSPFRCSVIRRCWAR